MQRTQRSFLKNIKERKERNVLLQERNKNARMLRSFGENTCPTLILIFEIYIYIYKIFIKNIYILYIYILKKNSWY